jgi:phospholipid-binding lipoprotein MlaA
MEETLVEDTFEDPFATEGEPVHDPWEPFNTRTFTLNYNIDRYFLKPTARVYSAVVAPDVQDSLANAFNNLGFASRFLNNVFQGKFDRAGTEMQRFLLNSILGVGGLFDVAKYMFDIEAPPAEDAGQTLATYGMASGPFMVLPLLPPMTVRDAVGIAGDIFMNPVNYFMPFTPNLVLNATGRVNSRAINLDTFEGLEESTIDLYGAVRSGYLDRRTKAIAE